SWPASGRDDPAQAQDGQYAADLVDWRGIHLRRSTRLVEPAAACHAVMISGRRTGDNTISNIAIGRRNDMYVLTLFVDGIRPPRADFAPIPLWALTSGH